MKFSDIPQFTKRPAYHVNISLDYLEEWVEDHEKELGLQLNPDFQRGHVWVTSQQIAYIEYLLRGGQSGKDFYFNRVGGMHNFTNQKASFVCVDGLQRITACQVFLHNKIPVFGHYLNEFEDRLRMSNVMFSVYINDLPTKKDVLVWYLEMNTGGTPHTEKELSKVRMMLEEEQ